MKQFLGYCYRDKNGRFDSQMLIHAQQGGKLVSSVLCYEVCYSHAMLYKVLCKQTASQDLCNLFCSVMQTMRDLRRHKRDRNVEAGGKDL